MSVIRRIRKKFEYPKNMKEKILQHEDEMLKYYSEIITEKYGEFFQRNGCSVVVKLNWGNDLKRAYSERRMKFELGYSCDVCCKIQKKGKTVEVFIEEEDIGWYPLVKSWKITIINLPFNNPPYLLIKDFEEFYEDMDELQELLSCCPAN
ncbi:MAG: hypothetical protein V8S08_09435 [Lachnoclostridium sp.]